MRKSKIILAILLLIVLVAVGIVLPYLWRNEHKTASSPAAVKQSVSAQETVKAPALTYIDFEQIDAYLPETVVRELEELLPAYLAAIGVQEELDITFLPDATSYPSDGSTSLTFQLSDETLLPVLYLSSGSFLFGEEKMELTPETTIYEKPNDPSLPDVNTEEIDARQEGGIPASKEVQP